MTLPPFLLFAEYNYVAWDAAMDYRKTFANLEIYDVPKAGHYIQFEQPEVMIGVIRSFLLDQPDVIQPYTGDGDPRSFARGSSSAH